MEAKLTKDGSVKVIDATGKAVMPGLIDSHARTARARQ